jgi:hypothetical protein
VGILASNFRTGEIGSLVRAGLRRPHLAKLLSVGPEEF